MEHQHPLLKIKIMHNIKLSAIDLGGSKRAKKERRREEIRKREE